MEDKDKKIYFIYIAGNVQQYALERNRNWKWHHDRMDVLVVEINRKEYIKRRLLNEYKYPSKSYMGDNLIDNICFGKCGLNLGKTERSAFFKKFYECVDFVKEREKEGHEVLENEDIKKYKQRVQMYKHRSENVTEK